jgi:hypothetical protein
VVVGRDAELEAIDAALAAAMAGHGRCLVITGVPDGDGSPDSAPAS